MGSVGRAWEAADALLTRDGSWVGTDDAYSVPLGDDRTLWLFGDTFLGDRAEGRAAAGFVSNTVAVQSGLDPSTATLMRWPLDPADGAVFVAADAGEWLWPLHGIRLGAGALLFFMRVTSTRPELATHAEAWEQEGSLGFFRVVGAAARWVDDVDIHPREWRPRTVALPDGEGVLGTAVLGDEDHVYAYAYRAGDALLARWTREEASAHDLLSPQWWAGAHGWHDDPVLAVPVMSGVVTEFTVHRHRDGRFLHVQVGDPLDPAVEVRAAPRPEGPWSLASPVYTPPEAGREGVIAYAGKAHPELVSDDPDDLVVTYASIALTREATLADESVYWPRFARVQP
jgi:hypothetical protein